MSVEQQVQRKLQEAFLPVYLDVQNESHGHNVPAGSETHFRVVIVSEAFDRLSQVERHRQVYKVLAEEMAGVVHALAVSCYLPVEWRARNESPRLSPACMGGSSR